MTTNLHEARDGLLGSSQVVAIVDHPRAARPRGVHWSPPADGAAGGQPLCSAPPESSAPGPSVAPFIENGCTSQKLRSGAGQKRGDEARAPAASRAARQRLLDYIHAMAACPGRAASTRTASYTAGGRTRRRRPPSDRPTPHRVYRFSTRAQVVAERRRRGATATSGPAFTTAVFFGRDPRSRVRPGRADCGGAGAFRCERSRALPGRVVLLETSRAETRFARGTCFGALCGFAVGCGWAAGEDPERRSHRQPPPESAADETFERSPSGRRRPPGCALVNRALPPLAAGAVFVLRSADRAANGLGYAYADASRRASPVTHGPD